MNLVEITSFENNTGLTFNQTIHSIQFIPTDTKLNLYSEERINHIDDN